MGRRLLLCCLLGASLLGASPSLRADDDTMKAATTYLKGRFGGGQG